MGSFFRLFRRIQGNQPLHLGLTLATLGAYPVLLVMVTETTHLQSWRHLLSFIQEAFGIFLYDIFFLSIIFAALCFLVRRVWIAMALEGAVLYTLSLVEYFKYGANGTHFSIADLVMAGKVSDIARFARLDVTGMMVVNLIILVLFVAWSALLNLRVRLAAVYTVPVGVGTVAALLIVLGVPNIYTAVYDAFGVDHTVSYSPYGADENFQNNMQIAYLSQNISSEITRKLSKPKGYSERAIQALLPQNGEEAQAGAQRPDIVLIMSEAYTDMRRFQGLPVPDGTYENFDRLCKEGSKGHALVPTFGGYTCKTEYELLFGLPVKGINDEAVPHQLFLEGEPRPTLAAYLREQGYTASFIHPFSESFYNRDQAYRSYGFDHLYFENDITVKKTRLGEYIDDSTLVRQIQQILERAQEPQFIFAVSMQNHGPYTGDFSHMLGDVRLSKEENAEMGRYLYGIGLTDKALGELATYLRQRNRPTIFLMVGDHYPYLGRQGRLYGKIDSTGNAYSLYQQPYFLWTNYQSSYQVPQTRLSSFYLPHLLVDCADLPKSRFMLDMQEMMKTTPLFTFDLGNDSPDAAALMQLTYDRTQGEGYSEEKGTSPQNTLPE